MSRPELALPTQSVTIEIELALGRKLRVGSEIAGGKDWRLTVALATA